MPNRTFPDSKARPIAPSVQPLHATSNRRTSKRMSLICRSRPSPSSCPGHQGGVLRARSVVWQWGLSQVGARGTAKWFRRLQIANPPYARVTARARLFDQDAPRLRARLSKPLPPGAPSPHGQPTPHGAKPHRVASIPAFLASGPQGWIETRRGLTGLTRGNERLALTQYNLYCAELFISRPTHPRSLRTRQQPDRRKPKLRVRYLPSPTSIPTGWPPLDSIESASPEDLACIQGGTPDRNPGGGRVAS